MQNSKQDRRYVIRGYLFFYHIISSVWSVVCSLPHLHDLEDVASVVYGSASHARSYWLFPAACLLVPTPLYAMRIWVGLLRIPLLAPYQFPGSQPFVLYVSNNAPCLTASALSLYQSRPEAPQQCLFLLPTLFKSEFKLSMSSLVYPCNPRFFTCLTCGVASIRTSPKGDHAFARSQALLSRRHLGPLRSRLRRPSSPEHTPHPPTYPPVQGSVFQEQGPLSGTYRRYPGGPSYYYLPSQPNVTCPGFVVQVCCTR
ncbi:hypothetical protein F5Y19DRAFT_187588 [Xylariaceae sp. FL1651]|nr:hypothetical protein F5Y19DRAFT_187588 [Xylariaceae sp. FL1651]